MAREQQIRAGWLIDGSGAAVRKNVLLTLKGPVIHGIEDFADNGCHPDVPLTDLSDCCILPPLVDCHVHITLSGSTDPHLRRKQSGADCGASRQQIFRNIRSYFTHGVLAVRDAGDCHGHGLRFKEEKADREELPVIVKHSGRGWHRKGRYGGMIARCPQEGESLAAAFCREDEHNTDHVKIIQSGINSLTDYGRETAEQFCLEELAELVKTAHRRGLKVMAHANGQYPVRTAIAAGCDSIEHGFFMGQENLNRMAGKGTVWVPTICTMKAMGRATSSDMPGRDPAVLEKTLQQQLRQLGFAKSAGVKVAMGTDAGSWGVDHGVSLASEIQLFMEAGYSLPQALRCASVSGAELLGVEQYITELRAGAPATFIAVNASPAMLAGRLAAVKGVWLNGVLQGRDLRK